MEKLTEHDLLFISLHIPLPEPDDEERARRGQVQMMVAAGAVGGA